MDPDQTERMRRLVWIHAGRKRIMSVLSWRGSYLKSGEEVFGTIYPMFSISKMR
jgi:hypothetical protein